MYALKETTSGLYLDIQTGVKDGHNYYDDNLSLSANPCVIYFAKETTDNAKWTMKNANGEYVMQAGDRHWIVRFGETAYEWTIAEPESGKFTIARADGKFIGADNITAGVCLYCDRGTALKFKVMEVSYSYEQGDIQSSADLMAATTATHIAVKNISSTNSKYYAGASNIDAFSADVVLVWEPVDGEAGKFYLRTAADATNGYVQTTADPITLGAKGTAQKFYTVAPTFDGTKPAALASGTTFIDGADADKLVRFVEDGGNTWLNVQGTTGKSYPILGNSGTGNWTVHNVYAVNVTTNLTEAVFEDTDPYVLLKTSSGTYLSTTSVANDTHLSIQAEGTKFVLETSQDGNAYYIKVLGSSPARYVSTYSGNAWGSSTSETPYAWSFSDPDENGYVTISRVGAPTYCLGTTFTPNAGTAVYSNAGSEDGTPNKWLIEEYNVGAVGYTFQITNPTGKAVTATYNGNAVSAGEIIEIEGLVDKSLFDATDVEGYAWSVVVNSDAKTITIVYVEKYNGSYYLKTSSGTYLNLTPHASLSTSATFQATGTEFYIEPSGDNYYITQLNSNPVKYFTVSSSNAWDVTTSTTAFPWSISVPDANDFVTITKATDSGHRLGNDGNQNAGTGVFANVGASCNTWQLVKVGPLDYTFAITNPTGEAVSAKYNGNAITAGATISIDGRVDTSLFSANEIEGYIWKVELDPDTRTITLVYEKKYNWSIVGLPDGAAVTYNSAAVADGGIVGVDYDSQYLAVTCPNGYTWAVTRDNENKIITITFSQLQSEVNPQSVVDLLNRIGGEGTADKFKIVLDPSLNYTADQFSINGEGGKVLIKGTTISAITTGIGWYLQNYAHINIAWNSLNEKTVSGDAYADLSSLPIPTSEETRTSDAMYRYYLNTCAFGYSMTSWTWKRWQQEIDWMALHGINMPLQLVGMEEVWRKFLTMEENGTRKYGYTDAEAKAFVAGPAFIAWWAMNNLEGWGGTAPGKKSSFNDLAGAGGVQDDAWYARQKNLAKQICDRQRELGMQPVIPGWSGMVPTNFASKSGYATRGNGGNWAGDFVRPLLLSVSNANYAEIAADYYTCLHEVMGESQYYSMDPFHEGGGAGTMEDYTAMYNAMETAMPGSKWVIQQWQWTSTQRYSLTAVPAGRLVVLDLFADGSPAFDSYNGFAPQDAVFCAIPNFGGRSGIMARLTNLTDNYFKFKAKYPATIKGVGAAPEAIEQTPVTYDLIFQLPWMGSKPDVAEWVDNYAISRYGQDNEEIKEAWSLLRQGPLNYGADGIEGPIEDVWASRPNLVANYASSWGSTISKSSKGVNVAATYTKARRQMLIDATYKLLNQNNAISGDIYLSNYYYDLVEFGGGVLADYAHDLLLAIGAAKTAAGANFATDATYIARRDAFLQLILDVDAFKGTNLNFRLGKWTQEARDAAGEVVGATTATPDWYEYNNARTIVSTWSSPGTNLNDYSYRSWQGLMKDLYYPRWKHYFDNNCNAGNYDYFAWNWAHGMEYYVGQTAISSTPLTSEQAGHTSKYTREPEGNTVEKANELLGKYIIPVKLADGSTYYAYRCLSNGLNLTLTTTQGATLDLSEYITFGNTDGLTMSITSSLIDGTATKLSAVTIKADACGGADSVTDVVTVALSDGTSLTLTVVVETSALATAKEELAALIEEMEGLAAQVATYNPVGKLTEVPLTTTQGSDGYIWTNAQSSAEGPIAQLIDNNINTHFHTDYSNGSVTSGIHYIAIDLGADYEIGKFTIDYTTRNGGDGDFPDGFVVYASETNGDDYAKIAEITEPAFPQSTNKKWELGKNLYSKKRYLRFNVNAERGYWHMSEFNIYRTSSTAEVVDKYRGVIENDFAAEKYDVLVDAKNTYDYGETTLETTNAVDALKAAIVALREKMAELYDYPFTLTTDEENPVLYNIYHKRTGSVMSYDSENGKVDILEKVNNNIYQAWYFMTGTDGAVLIKPYNGDGKVLGANNTSDGNDKLIIATTATYKDWTIEFVKEENGENYYFIKTNGTFVNDHSNNTDNIGFWSGANASTNGSLFKFVAAEFENDNPRFYQMKDLNAQLTAGYIAGTSVGFYTETSVNAINEKQAVATALETAGSASSSAADCYAAYKAMREAEDNVEYIEPDPAKVYYIVSASTKDYCAGKYLHTNNEPIERTTASWGPKTYTHEHLMFAAIDDITHKQLAAFQFEKTGVVGEYKMKSLNSGLYVKSFAGTHMGTKGDAQAVKIAPYATGQLTLKVGNNDPMHAQNDYSVIVQWPAEENGASLWIINEVTDATAFNYTLTVPSSGIATLYLPFNVTLPKGVTAYTVDPAHILQKGDGTYYYDELTQVAAAGEKLAMGTAVIIKATAGEYTFEATFDDTDAKTAAASALVGTYYKQTVSTGYGMAVENNEPIFNRITADTAVEPYNCWLVADGITTDKIGLTTDFLPAEIEDGKVYRIRGRLSNGVLRTLYNNGANKKILWTGEAKDDASTIFIAQEGEDGKFKLVSALANGYWSQDAKIAEEGVELTFANGSVNGTAMIVGNNGRRFCVDGDDLDFYSNVAVEPANAYVNENVTTDFVFELVEDVTVGYTLRMAKNNAYATLYLPYAVTVPSGVTAYIAHSPTTSLMMLTDVKGVIPANTPVVIKRETTNVSEDYLFAYTTDAPAIDFASYTNRLKGYLIDTLVEGETGYNYYMLMRYNTVEAFYWILKEYDENGKLYTGLNQSTQKTHIKCIGNKAFFSTSTPNNSASYRFVFEGTTGIDGVDAEGNGTEAIYDLQGRKLQAAPEKGVYIVNGELIIK